MKQTPSYSFNEQQKQSQTISRETERTAAKIAALPLGLTAAMAIPSYALVRMRNGERVITGLSAGALFGLLRNGWKVAPTVLGKQSSRSAAGFAAPDKKAAEESNTARYAPAAFAVGVETGFSGLNGVMAGYATEQLKTPTNIGFFKKVSWGTKAMLHYTPLTVGLTSVASAANVAGVAAIMPTSQRYAAEITDNKYLQKTLALLFTSGATAALTTPVNTLLSRSLKGAKVEQNGLKLSVTPTKTPLGIAKEIIAKEGLLQGVRALERAWPLTTVMTGIAYSAVLATNELVDFAIPDTTAPKSLTTNKCSIFQHATTPQTSTAIKEAKAAQPRS